MGPPRCTVCGHGLNKRWGLDARQRKLPRHLWRCPHCLCVLRCFQHCECSGDMRQGWGGQRAAGVHGAASRALTDPGVLAPAATVATTAARVVATSAAPAPARERSPRRAADCARMEGRIYTRSEIEHRLIAQWRHCASPEERPLPTEGAHRGLLPGTCWSDVLGTHQCRELLQSARWRQSREHASVHITLCLRWAEAEMARRSSSRQGGMELGRFIQSFRG
jgi:hypothetical protein